MLTTEYRPPPPGFIKPGQVPFPDIPTQRLIDDYTRALVRYRQALERLQGPFSSPDPAAEAELKSAGEALDGLEGAAFDHPDSLPHIQPLIDARSLMAVWGPEISNVGQVDVSPLATRGGRLRGLSYAQARERLGPPDLVLPPDRGPSGRDPQTGAGSITWKVIDPATGSSCGIIRLDVPTPEAKERRFQSAENPHFSRERLNGDKIDEQGVVVPEESTSAHFEIAADHALEDEFARAR